MSFYNKFRKVSIGTLFSSNEIFYTQLGCYCVLKFFYLFRMATNIIVDIISVNLEILGKDV